MMQLFKGFLFSSFLLLIPFHYSLASEGFQDSLEETGIGTGHINEGERVSDGSIYTIIGTVINVALSLIGIFFLVLMIYSGYVWMMSRGNEAEAQKAKDTITRAIIGLVIILSAYAITNFVGGKL